MGDTLYSDYVRSLSGSDWWQSEEGHRVANKRRGREMAIELGLRVPELLVDSERAFVVKPVSGHSGAGVQLVSNPSKVLIEEAIVDVDGRCPPRVFDMFVFGAHARLLRVRDTADTKADLDSNRTHFVLPEGRQIFGESAFVDRKPCEIPPPRVLAELTSSAERVSALFPGLLALRVDFFWSKEGIIYNEMCATPGFVLHRQLTPQLDRYLGSCLA